MKYSILEKINIIFFATILILSSISILLSFFFASTAYIIVVYSIISLLIISKKIKNPIKFLSLSIITIFVLIFLSLTGSGYMNLPGLDLSTLFLGEFIGFITAPFLPHQFSYTNNFYSSLFGSILMFIIPILLIFSYIVKSKKKEIR